MRHVLPVYSTRAVALLLALRLLLPAATFPAEDSSPHTTLPAALKRTNAEEAEQRIELQHELQRKAEVLDAQSAVVKIVAKLLGPAVVHIEADIPAEPGSGYSRRHRVEEAGSGVIVELQGNHYVLTNRHVVRGAAPEAIRINLADGRRIHPQKVLEDADTDVGVLLLSAPDLVSAPLGNSDAIEIGDFVLALGSPFGLSRSVTFGIISGKGRRDLRLSEANVKFQDFLQTDAAINPGNSGGPLVNLRGEVIGINTAIASNSGGNEGIGFAIPVNMFMVVARQLIDTGSVSRAFLGVNLNSKFGPSMAAELGLPRLIGAHVSGITPGSPAAAAGIQIGDVILEFDNTTVENDAHLVNLVGLTPIGKRASIVIFRDRKPMSIMVELGERGKFDK